MAWKDAKETKALVRRLTRWQLIAERASLDMSMGWRCRQRGEHCAEALKRILREIAQLSRPAKTRRRR